LMGTLLIVMLPLFRYAIDFLVPTEGRATALIILPYALFSFWGMLVSSVLLGALDGCQRIDLRSALMTVSQLINLGLAILWVPVHGLEGVARAQVVQAFGLAIFSWWILRRQIGALPLLPLRWRGRVLRGMLWYGFNFQVMSIMAMLFDPVTKALMSKLGGLAALGYYEMASKLVLQLRAIIIESNRVVIPIVARLKEHSADTELRRLFEASLRMSLVVSATGYGIVSLCSPTISFLWIGKTENIFVSYVIILSTGWFVNTLAGPAYFHNLGVGRLARNVLGQIIIATSNLLLGISAGLLWGGTGVVSAFSASLVFGSIVIIFSETFSREVVAGILISKDGLFLLKQLLVAVAGLLAFSLLTEVSGSAIVGHLFLIVLGVLAGFLACQHWQQHARRVIGT
ncbi:MAG: lipopolysaccharide biosynthesis protein, partial [Nitrososphaerales archaeon]